MYPEKGASNQQTQNKYKNSYSFFASILIVCLRKYIKQQISIENI